MAGLPALGSPAQAADQPYVVGAIKWQGSKAQLFFSDGSYERIDLETGTVEAGYPKPVTDQTWPGLGAYARDIVAACDGPAGAAYFFISDGRYVRYDVTGDHAEPGYPKPVNDQTWPGLGPYAAALSSALDWKDGKLQFFLSDGRYLRYDIAADHVDPGYPQPVDDKTWPGLEPYKDLLAGTFNLDGRKAFLFLKDNRYIRYDITADRIDPGYPKPM
ncbi:MAG: hypothetical protein JO305_08660 [Alphaproteobacteria bacterium]|nr:hypothetical protein [Alphaproteobacteria bacterium]